MTVTITTIAIICLSAFSVLIPIQSEKVIIYNYDNFGEVFPQGNQTDFNIYKYKDINDIFKEKYQGTNIGGAFRIERGSTAPTIFTPWLDGYIVDVSVTVYCGKLFTDQATKLIGVHYPDRDWDYTFVCDSSDSAWTVGWTYNHTFVPTRRFGKSAGVQVSIYAINVTINEPFGFDEIRITTVEKIPPTTTAPLQIATNHATAPKKNP